MTTDSPVSILYDNLGNPVGVVLDGAVYRLQVEAKLTSGNTIDITDRTNRKLGIINQSTNAVRTTINASISDVQLLASNSARIGVIIFNNSDSPLHIGFGSVPVTTDDSSFVISAHDSWVVDLYFSGEIRGVWETAAGDARVTELT